MKKWGITVDAVTVNQIQIQRPRPPMHVSGASELFFDRQQKRHQIFGRPFPADLHDSIQKDGLVGFAPRQRLIDGRLLLDMKPLCRLERLSRLPQNGQRIPLIGPKGNDIFLIHFSLFLVSVTDTSSRIPGMGEPGL